jgi:hypothetical protein
MLLFSSDGESRENNISNRSTVSQLLLRALYRLILRVKGESFNLWTSTEAGRLPLNGVDSYHVFPRGYAVFNCDGAVRQI